MCVTHFKTFFTKDTMSSFTEQITPKTSGMQYKIEKKFQKCKMDYSIYTNTFVLKMHCTKLYFLRVNREF